MHTTDQVPVFLNKYEVSTMCPICLTAIKTAIYFFLTTLWQRCMYKLPFTAQKIWKFDHVFCMSNNIFQFSYSVTSWGLITYFQVFVVRINYIFSGVCLPLSLFPQFFPVATAWYCISRHIIHICVILIY